METRQQRFMYDDRLSPMAKIFLAEISHYTGTFSSCLDDELYFATIFKTSTRQVRRWKRELLEVGYIKIGKSQLGRRTLEYVPDLQNHEQEVTPTRTIVYRTNIKGKLLHNPFETIEYFGGIIENSSVPATIKDSVRMLANVLANCMWDENYYNFRAGKLDGQDIFMTEDFYQFIVQNFSAEVLWTTAYRVRENYPKVQILTRYILICIAKNYFEEYMLFRKKQDKDKRLQDNVQKAIEDHKNFDYEEFVTREEET